MPRQHALLLDQCCPMVAQQDILFIYLLGRKLKLSKIPFLKNIFNHPCRKETKYAKIFSLSTLFYLISGITGMPYAIKYCRKQQMTLFHDHATNSATPIISIMFAP